MHASVELNLVLGLGIGRWPCTRRPACSSGMCHSQGGSDVGLGGVVQYAGLKMRKDDDSGRVDALVRELRLHLM
jgi:hypothetical protein